GTAYVSAVAAFAAFQGAAGEGETAQARDAALAAMYGAARELAQLPAADASASAIYQLVSSTRNGEVPLPGRPRGVSF
ncbi:MAG TPA: hypothetical protein VFX98_07335, partial [Longimicrobiaceae bacterium]|nr:hypothetical protein [Longimicrobiaceae bacterium]